MLVVAALLAQAKVGDRIAVSVANVPHWLAGRGCLDGCLDGCFAQVTQAAESTDVVRAINAAAMTGVIVDHPRKNASLDDAWNVTGTGSLRSLVRR